MIDWLVMAFKINDIESRISANPNKKYILQKINRGRIMK